jgi:hypothetical protein
MAVRHQVHPARDSAAHFENVLSRTGPGAQSYEGGLRTPARRVTAAVREVDLRSPTTRSAVPPFLPGIHEVLP